MRFALAMGWCEGPRWLALLRDPLVPLDAGGRRALRWRRRLAGIPALSVPCRAAPAEGGRPELPIGLQLMGPPLEEERLFTVAAAFESTCPPRSAPLA